MKFKLCSMQIFVICEIITFCFTFLFTARRYRGICRRYVSVCASVCLSVCHKPVLSQIMAAHSRIMQTTPTILVFLTPNIFVKFERVYHYRGDAKIDVGVVG